jgi:hypothetical protein
MTEFAFVLGNGRSRLILSVKDLKKRGTVYGCNRIYETDEVDVLVSTDLPMAKEIQESGYSKLHSHYTREANIITHSGAKALDKRWAGYSSGPNALALAAKANHPYIFMLGMDLISEDNKINNIYAGTQHYKDINDILTPYTNWINQIQQIIREFPNQRFYHVHALLNFTPEPWKQFVNFETQSLLAFKDMINN